ncbi:plasmid maintenance system antidote protein, XRE family [Methylophaga frappieri]|uniref:Plasmid maintenance system antidote protein, XRE family n=1 Tax=Methylophaga frappieri (strain ATCC BAA-2434 / DSM 25690 / JAM7) TaxID=754477 RepID=I1YI39_METFJ|nr:HigA family addiction module antitoxin [Methylophaga frappieri]AFJ02582.1 plasmid maintenance system antidote protein, XRE family [Methylophaga frappieri]
MTFQQHNPPHVGELIYRTYIEPFDDVSANKIAVALGVSPSTFNRLLNGKSDLSPEMAVRLSAVLGRTAESWLRLQESYDLWQAKQKVDTKSLHKIDFAQFAEQVRGELLEPY